MKSVVAVGLLATASAFAQNGGFSLEIPGVASGARAPNRIAFCKSAEVGGIALSDNRSPPLRWRDAPAATRSFVVTMHDPDVPADASGVNKNGIVIAAAGKRVDFHHWLLVDIPASSDGLAEAVDSDRVTPRGKLAVPTPVGRRGINDYTSFFAGDAAMSGTYAGYDGPCPPWNDERPHRYVFTVRALDVEQLSLPAAFSGKDVEAAVVGHVLGTASVTLTYDTRAAKRP